MYKISLREYWRKRFKFWRESYLDSKSIGDVYGMWLDKQRMQQCLNRSINEAGQTLNM